MKILITCVVAGIQYLLHPQKIGSIQETINPDALLPVTLLTTDEIFGDLEGILDLFDQYDDVFTPDFGAVLVEKPNGTNESNAFYSRGNGAASELYHLGEVVGLSQDLAELPSGPYFLHGPNLHQAWRLYEDNLGAFTFGAVPEDVDEPESFEVVNALSPQGSFKSIPVPSRLYFPRPSSKKPLSGVRVSLGDNIALNGLQTTFSSRAWQSTNSNPANETAAYAQKLIDQGAIIVGKTKMGQFGTGVDWVDEQAPWSSRGDGYQKVSGSAAGATSGMMGYKWLDQAVGSGTCGNYQGIYSLSPSADSVSLDGVLTASQCGDSVLLSRSLDGMLGITNSLNTKPAVGKLPTKILYLGNSPSTLNKHAETLVRELVEVLGQLLHAKPEEINLGEAWKNSPPPEAGDNDLHTFMKNTALRPFSYEYYHLFEDFRDGYRGKFDREPFAEKTPQTFWDIGENVAHEEYEGYLKRMEIFRQWFGAKIMPLKTGSTPDTVLVLPCQPPRAQYRDERPAPLTTPEGVPGEFLASILRAPQLTFPFAQLPYKSRISGGTEYLPFCASLIGASGSDATLVHLVKQAFERAKWLTVVETGRLTFPLGDNPRNVNNQGQYLQTKPPEAESAPEEL